MSTVKFEHKDFDVLTVLGTGGSATVYKCRDRATGALRAVKVLDASLAHKTEVLLRFEKEAEAMAKLSHAHIVPLHSVSMEGEHRFIVMDFIDGESLLGRMERGPLVGVEAVRIMIPVLDALVAAHNKGLVHRDVKPHNILISRAEHVFVTDFGIARFVGDTDMSITRTGVMMGTWAYMAPEQRADAKGVDHLADIYSAGATLFAAVTGNTPKDLFAAELDPTIYKGVPPKIEAVIRRACAYWTSDRYATAQAMLDDLQVTLTALRSDVGKVKDHARVVFRTDPGSPSPGRPPPPVPAAKEKKEELKPKPAPKAPVKADGIDLSEKDVLIAAGLGLVALVAIFGWMYTKMQPDPIVAAVVVEAPIDRQARKGRIGADEMDKVVPMSSAILHEVPAAVVLEEDFRLVLSIPGDVMYDQVVCWFRPRTSGEWSKTKLRKVGDHYEGSILVSRLFVGGLEYWIEAKPYTRGLPVLSSANPRRPHRVTVIRN